jgi:hypothetical protein
MTRIERMTTDFSNKPGIFCGGDYGVLPSNPELQTLNPELFPL